MAIFQRRNFIISALIFGLLGLSSVQALEYADLEFESKLITVGDPMDPKYANAGDNLRNGVGSIYIQFDGITEGGFLCTATAISPTHILTAAHCVVESNYTVSRVRFILNAGLPAPLILEADSFAVHPWYPQFLSFGYGAFAHGDIAVIELVDPLPANIDIYDLYRDFDEFNQEARHYGHGRSGKGTKGDTGNSDFYYARTGLNTYEQYLAPLLDNWFEDQLIYDFDSGGSKHNAMAWWFSTNWMCSPSQPDNPDWAQDGQCTTFKDGSYPDFKGFQKMEIGIAPGDSGGPAFIDDKIAGVHSFGFTHFCEGTTNGTDFTCGLDSSYGEMNGDTRVSFHANFVDDVVNDVFPTTPIGAAPATISADSGSTSDFVSPAGRYFIENVYSSTMRTRVE